jgi:hypothetical protein
LPLYKKIPKTRKGCAGIVIAFSMLEGKEHLGTSTWKGVKTNGPEMYPPLPYTTYQLPTDDLSPAQLLQQARAKPK